MAQTSGRWDSSRKIWIIKAVGKGGAVVTAAAATIRLAIEILKSLM